MEYKKLSKVFVDMNYYQQQMRVPRHKEILFCDLLKLHKNYMSDFQILHNISPKIRHAIYCKIRNGLEVKLN